MPLSRATPLPKPFAITGHAIVSADGMIAMADGSMPEGLRVDADWQTFQAALDKSVLVVLGRKGHAHHPNRGRRRRLVLTRSVNGLGADPSDPLAHLWNPAGMPLPALLTELQITGGDIAITGGQGVFDYFAPAFTSFLLSEVHDLVMPNGITCFSDAHPRQALAHFGLHPQSISPLERDGQVTATLWQR